MKKESLVSIVIPTHNRRLMAERLILSLLNGSYKNIEIIVVDDCSSDATSDFLRKRIRNKKLRLYRNKKNIFTAGSRNVGQEKSRGRYILFIDDDNLTDKDMIREMVKVIESDPKIGEVGPVNYDFNKKSSIFWAGSNRSMWTTKTHHTKTLYNKEFWETDDVPNAFMVKSQIVKTNKIKFKKSLGIMYEESDYAYRIKRHGYKIMVARRARIYHDIEENVKKNKKKDYMYHFMTDNRRPFVFARNRIVFHTLYSQKIQLFGILFFWVWFFVAYYIYKILFYSGYGNFDINKRIELALEYLKGTAEGLKFARDRV